MQGERQIEYLFFWRKSQDEVYYCRNKSSKRSSVNKTSTSSAVGRAFENGARRLAREGH